MSYTGDMWTTLGGPAAAGAPSGNSSLTRMSFSELEATVRFLESLGLGIPDSFLDSSLFIPPNIPVTLSLGVTF